MQIFILLGSIIITLCVVYVIAWIYYRAKNDNISKHDKLIDLITSVVFYITVLINALIFSKPELFAYFLFFSILGVILEYSVGWFYFQLFGARLYNYYRRDLLGFSTLAMMPLWGGAGLYFLALIPLFKLNLVDFLWTDYVRIFFTFGTGLLFSLLIGVSLIDLIRRKVTVFRNYTKVKYLLFNSFFIGGVLGVSMERGLNYLVYFVFAAVTGIVLEGILGKTIHKIHGEVFWKYYRGSLFKGNTSTAIIPLWFGAVSLSLVLILIFIRF